MPKARPDCGHNAEWHVPAGLGRTLRAIHVRPSEHVVAGQRGMAVRRTRSRSPEARWSAHPCSLPSRTRAGWGRSNRIPLSGTGGPSLLRASTRHSSIGPRTRSASTATPPVRARSPPSTGRRSRSGRLHRIDEEARTDLLGTGLLAAAVRVVRRHRLPVVPALAACRASQRSTRSGVESRRRSVSDSTRSSRLRRVFTCT